MARVIRSVREQVKKWALWPAIGDVNMATHNLLNCGNVSTVIKKGSSTFAGGAGQVITHNYGATTYICLITPTADPGGYLGEVWVIKANDTVTVYNGTATGGAFDYIILSL